MRETVDIEKALRKSGEDAQYAFCLVRDAEALRNRGGLLIRTADEYDGAKDEGWLGVG